MAYNFTFDLTKIPEKFFKEIEEIESKYKIALSSMNDRKTKSARRAQSILKYIEIGMRPKEVQYILGEAGWREKNSPCYAGILCWGYDDVLIVFNGERPSAEVDKILFHRPHMKSVLLKDYSYNALRDGLPPTIVKPQPFKQEIAYIKKYILGH